MVMPLYVSVIEIRVLTNLWCLRPMKNENETLAKIKSQGRLIQLHRTGKIAY